MNKQTEKEGLEAESKCFEMEKAIKQGNLLSSLVFIVAMDISIAGSKFFI